AWSDMFATFRMLVRELRWLAADDQTKSATLTAAFGAVFLPLDPERLRINGVLVHEATHLELVTRMSLDKLVTNGSDRAPAPFKTFDRPLTRVLHATLVAARLVDAYDRCVDHVNA